MYGHQKRKGNNMDIINEEIKRVPQVLVKNLLKKSQM